jgi:hypothetical protein
MRRLKAKMSNDHRTASTRAHMNLQTVADLSKLQAKRSLAAPRSPQTFLQLSKNPDEKSGRSRPAH